MNQDNNMTKNHSTKQNEEIDLIDVLMQLWRGKLLIVSVMVLTILLAIVYLYVAKEKWTSEAIVTYPDSGEIASYNNAMGVLYVQNPANAPSVVDIQQRFFSRFNSAIFALSQQLANQANPEKLTIDQAVKDQPVPLKISYTSNNAAEAQKILNTYIQKLNKQVVSELDADLQITINSKIKDLKEDLATREEVAQEKKNRHLQILNQALLVAQQSNIKDTLVQQAETLSDDTLFVLGSNALSATIRNEASRPLPFDITYYRARQALLAISALKTNPDSTSALRYVMKPNLPIHRDSPKKGFILIIGALAGIILGSVFVLGRNMLKTYTPRS